MYAKLKIGSENVKFHHVPLLLGIFDLEARLHMRHLHFSCYAIVIRNRIAESRKK